MNNRLPIIVTAAILCSPMVSASNPGPSQAEFPYTQVNYSENRFHKPDPAPLSAGNTQVTSHRATVDDQFGAESPAKIRTGKSDVDVGLDVDHFYGTYGVLQARTGSNASTYLAFGFTLDEFTEDNPNFEQDDNGMGLSYGFGVTQESFKLEYMMYMDEGSNDISTIGIGLVSEF